MPYKLTTDGKIEAKDGLPVYVKEDGTETAVDFDKFMKELGSTRSESIGRKEKIREYEQKLKDYEAKYGNIDPSEAAKAIELMRNIDQNQLIKAGEKDAAIKQALENMQKEFAPKIKSYEDTLGKYTTEMQKKDAVINQMLIEGQLSSSQFLNKNTKTTPDVRNAILGKHFKVEEINGRLQPVAYKADGEKLYSPDNPGQLASFEEAVMILWSNYPNKDIYSLANHGGSGSTGNPSGAGSGGLKVYSRNEWNTLFANAKPEDKKQLARMVGKGEIKISK